MKRRRKVELFEQVRRVYEHGAGTIKSVVVEVYCASARAPGRHLTAPGAPSRQGSKGSDRNSLASQKPWFPTTSPAMEDLCKSLILYKPFLCHETGSPGKGNHRLPTPLVRSLHPVSTSFALLLKPTPACSRTLPMETLCRPPCWCPVGIPSRQEHFCLERGHNDIMEVMKPAHAADVPGNTPWVE
jgi:hypothetical protein